MGVVHEGVEERVFPIQIALSCLDLGHQSDGAFSSDKRRRECFNLSGEKDLPLPKVLELESLCNGFFIVAVDVAVRKVIAVAPVGFVGLLNTILLLLRNDNLNIALSAFGKGLAE